MTWREDKTLVILSFFTIFFTLVVLIVVWFRPNDGQIYQTFATMMSGFSGALTMYLTGGKALPSGTTKLTVTETEIPKEEKKPDV